MDNDDVKKTRYNLVKFISQFHKLFADIFKRDPNDKYCCNKNQTRAILFIGRNATTTPTILGQSIDMEKGSLTTLLGSLEEANLIFREIDPSDKRRTLVHLTEDGKVYYNELENKFNEKIEEVFSSLSKEDLRIFSNNLETLVKILEKGEGYNDR